jgi:hypothetical protein
VRSEAIMPHIMEEWEMATYRFFVGIDRLTGDYKAFRFHKPPTQANCGDLFAAVIGPFNTRRAAEWAAKYGRGNPHFQHVRDAERLCKFV